MESPALKKFRRKMANPVNWRMVHKTLQQYSKTDLANASGASRVIEQLASSLHITLSSEEQQSAANWLASQQLDPTSKRDRLRLWKSVKK